MTDPDRREAVILAVERAVRERFAASLPLNDDDDEWRREAEAVADAALGALEGWG
jgi:Arc/MetJ family transcription regulator